jgi:hypothetical protein
LKTSDKHKELGPQKHTTTILRSLSPQFCGEPPYFAYKRSTGDLP